jgi:NitT/TauT family transport system substrate-binding protein
MLRKRFELWRAASRSKTLAVALVLFAALATSTGAKSASSVTVVLDWIPYQPHHYAFWLAKDRGWYKDAGVDVKITNVMGSNSVIKAIVGGQGDIGLTSSAAFTKAVAEQKVPLKMVAVFHQKDVLSLRYFKKSGIKSPKDLEGKTVGLVTGSLAQTLWPAFARVSGVDAGKVNIVNTDWHSFNSALVTGKIDATNSALGLSQNITLGREGKTVGEFVFSDFMPIMGHGLIVSNDMLAKNAASVQAFVKATQRAWAYLEKDPKKGVMEAAAVVRKNVEKAPPEDLLIESGLMVIPSQLRQSSTQGKPLGWSSPSDWEKMVSLLVDAFKLSRKPGVDELFTNKFVQ